MKPTATLWLSAILCLAMCAPAAAESGDQDPVDQAFDGAYGLLADHQYALVADELVALAEENPEHGRAADAWFTAGSLFQDRLNLPERARFAFRTLVERYPKHRSARAAEVRLEDLDRLLGSEGGGREAQQRFHQLRSSHSDDDPDASLSAAAALLIDYPEWSGAVDVHMWIAEVEMRRGNYASASEHFEAAGNSQAPTAVRFSATLGAAEAATRSGRFADADALLRALAGQVGVTRQAVVDQALREVARARGRSLWAARAAWLGAGALVALLGLLWFGTRTGGSFRAALWPPPAEPLYLLPVIAVIAAIATTGYQGLAKAVLGIGAVGCAASWISAASLESRASGSGHRRSWVLVHALLSAVAVLALAWFIVAQVGLVEPVLETLAHGPDR